VLDIYAGKNARARIEQEGLHQGLFDVFLGASGGPKWFTLFGLDKYIFGEFFKDRTKPLDMVGSSAGAFRSACFAQKDPVVAITELGMRYSEITYSDKPTAAEITQSAIDMTEHLFAREGADSIANNPIFRAHFVVAKAKGLVGSDNKTLQGIGLLKAMMLNRMDRKHLNHQFERFVFKPASSDLTVYDPANIKTSYVDFDSANVKPSLLASGAIPYVMKGIKIPTVSRGLFRDGGIVDYHFDVGFNREGLTLYPHFSANPKAGWFDKNLARQVSASNYENTVMLVPSDEFIASLPYGKIPDRTDFENLKPAERLKYWRTVFSETEKLAESFAKQIENQNIPKMKNFSF